jgi:putative membrane protein
MPSKLTLLISVNALALAAAGCGGSTPPSNTPAESTDTVSSQSGPVEAAPSGATSSAGDTAASGTGTITGERADNTASGSVSPQASNDSQTGGAALQPGTADDSSSTGATTASTNLNDQQIAAITEGVNTSEIEQANLARSKSKNESVRSFASMMIEHHGQAKKQQSRMKVSEQPSPLAEQLESESRTTLEDLKQKSGPEFDRAYVQAQIDAHQKVLDTLERDLIPNAQDPELKSYLENLKPKVEQHLTQALSVQKRLDSSAQNSESPAPRAANSR